ncbi:MAG: hypothetical protein AB7U82_23225 [Blastocatellales bacterium]
MNGMNLSPLLKMPGITALLVAIAALFAATTAAMRPTPDGARAVRFKQNPIIQPQLGSIGNNINGPSLIRVPKWLPKPLGRYYLYFADHNGKYIRLAYADKLEGPWSIYEPGALKLDETICNGHIASPDVHVDEAKRELRMYFHGPVKAVNRQVTLVAASRDGIRFTTSKEILGDSYFRVFRWNGYYYAMARLGVLYRSRDGLTNFERGGNPFEGGSRRSMVRHVALKLDGDVLSVFYSSIGDSPESILMSRIDLKKDWKDWTASEPAPILKPEMSYEGADLPDAPSKEGAARGRVRQLRDPAIFREGGKSYLLYSVAGENGIAIAKIN